MYLKSQSSDTYIDEQPLNRAIRKAAEDIRTARGAALDEIFKSVLREVLSREPDDDDFRACVFYHQTPCNMLFSYSGINLGYVQITDSRPAEDISRMNVVFTPVDDFKQKDRSSE